MAAAVSSGAQKRQSYVLTYEPPKFSSLSAGTAFEVPADELERIRLEAQRSARQSVPRTLASVPESQEQSISSDAAARARADSTTSPPMTPSGSPVRQRGGAFASPSQQDLSDQPRKLFSLRGLRKSFSSSRNSLVLPRPSADVQPNRPVSPGFSVMSHTGSTAQSQASQPTHSPAGSPLRKKRSSSWFGRRRSGFFATGEDGMLAVVDEDTQLDAHGHKRPKANVPSLPEIHKLKGGKLGDGGLGWDEQMFKA